MPREEPIMDTTTNDTFPRVFWSANVTELFERAAYYSMASFVVIYLGQLGFGDYWPSVLNGSVLWTLVYFLPILSGTIADQIGFKRSLLIAFVLLTIGYGLVGSPVWFGGAGLSPTVASEVTATRSIVIPVVAGILLIGIGGSVIKPCVSGTVQKIAGARATLGFAIFYMIINIGSLFGRGTGYVVRRGYGTVTIVEVVAVCAAAAAGLVYFASRSVKAKEQGKGARMAIPFLAIVVGAGAAISWLVGGAVRAETGNSLSYIFAVAACASVVAFFVVLGFYQEPAVAIDAPAKPRRSIGRILLDMVLVLKSGRFTLFLIVMSGFFFVYNQVYNVLPLYAKRVIEASPAMDLYTAANPFVIVTLQLAITQYFGRLKAIRSIVVGTIIIGVSMLINVYPIYAAGGMRVIVANWLPLGSVFVILTVALIAFGELFASARMYEYIGSLAPKGQEGLFLGYANLPLAIGSFLGGPVGAYIFNGIMAKGATTRPDGLLELVPAQNALGWIILMLVGFVSAFAMWLFNRWLERHPLA
jgi:dipeptide/tripeptide permease